MDRSRVVGHFVCSERVGGKEDMDVSALFPVRVLRVDRCRRWVGPLFWVLEHLWREVFGWGQASRGSISMFLGVYVNYGEGRWP